jgi:competence protein ComEC
MIIFFDAGQADCILMFTPNGDSCLIDSGKTNDTGDLVAEYLSSEELNGVGEIDTIDLLYTTHYDLDHIGGIDQIVANDISFAKAFDQGLSKKRKGKENYTKYVEAVGDPNDNYVKDQDESDFVRNRIQYGHEEKIGLNDSVEIRCVSVRGDTKGTAYDIDRDATNYEIDENPGSIALLVRLGEFEFYTAGDQTTNKWKPKPAIERSIIASAAIPGGTDIDVLKVSNHGSDTSTSPYFIQNAIPEVAIITTEYTLKDKLPKKITLKTLQDNRCYTLITGDGKNPETGNYTSAKTTEDDDFTELDGAIYNWQRNVVVVVSSDGHRYTVYAYDFEETFSAKDEDNQRE